MDALKNLFSGPKEPAHKSGRKVENYVENYPGQPMDFEKGGELRPYWNERRENPRLRDREHPRPSIMAEHQVSDSQIGQQWNGTDRLQEDGIEWDASYIYMKPAEGPPPMHGVEGITENMPGTVSGGSVGSGGVGFVSLETAHDQNKDFTHQNMDPHFKGTPYYVTDRAIDDDIDYYARNDIRNRPEMKVADFAIHGPNREVNLNRREANMRANIEADFVPSRWKHDIQSIMPWDQLRDHSNNGKLYLPGEEPTKEDPLKPEWRPQAQTYEEYTNRTTVDAPGRIEAPLLGEKLFYHQKIEHLKRKNVRQQDFEDYTGYMHQGPGQGMTEGFVTGKRENRVLPDFSRNGIATGSTRRGRTEGMDSGRRKNRGRGTDLKHDRMGASGAKGHNEGMTRSKNRKSKNKRKATLEGQEAWAGTNARKKENFDYTVWAPHKDRRKNLHAIWNSRASGNLKPKVGKHATTISEFQEQALRQNKKQEYVENSRIEGNLKTRNARGMTAGKIHSSEEAGRKLDLADRDAVAGNVDLDNKSAMLRNDESIKSGLKETFRNLYSMFTRQGNVENMTVKGQTAGEMTGKDTRRSAHELATRTSGNVTLGHNKGQTAPGMTHRKNKRESFTYRGNAVGNLASDGYQIANVEARETLRSKVVKWIGSGFKDFGLVSHEPVRNIDWHADRNRKMHGAVHGTRANHARKQDLGWGEDQVNVDMWRRHKDEIPTQIINPQYRSHQAPSYGGEGLVNRRGKNAERKVERNPMDGEHMEFGFIKPYYTSAGKRRRRTKSKKARKARSKK